MAANLNPEPPMLPCMWKWMLVCAAALVCHPASGQGPTPKPRLESCIDRAAERAPPRSARLYYSCLQLANGRHVLVGEAGLPHTQTVLLVHGLGNNAHRDWSDVLPALARQFHVVALDLPGFGASEASPQGYSFNDLAAVLAEVLQRTAPGRRAHVVGHSLGGAVTLHFAHTHAARVERLVLVDAAGILLKTVFAQHVASVRSPQVGIDPVDRFLKGLDERVNGLRRSLFSGLDERFDFSRWLALNPNTRYALLGRYTQLEAGLGLVEHDFTTAIRDTAAPTTVIWGRDDPVAPLRTGHLLASRMPDARLQVIDGVGHTPMLESPQRFTQLLLDALAAPLAAPAAQQVPESSQGSVGCRNEPNRVFRGRYDSITLENCADARIENAHLTHLSLTSSTVTLLNSVIHGSDVALFAQGSEVVATGVQLRGRVAIRTADSRLDLAGVSLVATERGVEMVSPSRLYFSVSDWHGTDHQGAAHFYWPLPAGSP